MFLFLSHQSKTKANAHFLIHVQKLQLTSKMLKFGIALLVLKARIQTNMLPQVAYAVLISLLKLKQRGLKTRKIHRHLKRKNLSNA